MYLMYSCLRTLWTHWRANTCNSYCNMFSCLLIIIQLKANIKNILLERFEWRSLTGNINDLIYRCSNWNSDSLQTSVGDLNEEKMVSLSANKWLNWVTINLHVLYAMPLNNIECHWMPIYSVNAINNFVSGNVFHFVKQFANTRTEQCVS